MTEESEKPIQRISYGNRTYEFSFEVELESPEEQIDMQVDDPRELAKRTGKTVIMDDGKLVGLYDLEMNFGGNDE